MASQCVKDLRKVSEDLANTGFPVSAGVCHHAADRMERMEDLIVSLQDQVEAIDERQAGNKPSNKPPVGRGTKHRHPITGE